MSWLPQNALHVGQSGSCGSCLDDLCLRGYTRLCLSLGLALSCCFFPVFLLLSLPSLLFCLDMWQETFQTIKASRQQFWQAQSARADMLPAASTSPGTMAGLQSRYSSKHKEQCGHSRPGEVVWLSGSRVLLSQAAELHDMEAHLLGLLLQLHLLCEGTRDPRCSIVPLIWLMCHEPATREAGLHREGHFPSPATMCTGSVA